MLPTKVPRSDSWERIYSMEKCARGHYIPVFPFTLFLPKVEKKELLSLRNLPPAISLFYTLFKSDHHPLEVARFRVQHNRGETHCLAFRNIKNTFFLGRAPCREQKKKHPFFILRRQSSRWTINTSFGNRVTNYSALMEIPPRFSEVPSTLAWKKT